MTVPYCIDDIDLFISKIVANRYGMYTVKLGGEYILILKIEGQTSLLECFVTQEGQLNLIEALKWLKEEHKSIILGLVYTKDKFVLIGFNIENVDICADINVLLYYADHGRANMLTLKRDSKKIKEMATR